MNKVRGVLALSAARLLSAVLQFWVIRIILVTVGESALGAYYTMQNFSRWLVMLDLNYFDAAQRDMTRKFDSGDTKAGYESWATLRQTVLFNAALIFIAHVLIARFVVFNGFEFKQGALFFCAANGVLWAAYQAFFSFNAFFIARRMWGRLSGMNAVMSVLTSVLGVAGIYLMHSIEGYVLFYGIAIAIVVLLNLYLIERTRKQEGVEAKASFGLWKEFAKFGLRNIPNRIASNLTGATDRINVERALGVEAAAGYGNATRLPEAASEALAISNIIMPDLVSAHSQGRKEFGQAIQRLSLLAMSLGMAVIVIPCGYATPFLQLWLQKSFSHPMELVLIGVGLYKAIDMFYSTIGYSMFTEGHPEKIAPFVFYNGIITAFVTFPAVIHFGLVGAIYVKLFVHLSQLVPLLFYSRKVIGAEFNLSEWIFKFLGILLLGMGFMGICFLAATGIHSFNPLYSSIVLVPVCIYCYLMIIHRANLTRLPESIVRRLRLA